MKPGHQANVDARTPAIAGGTPVRSAMLPFFRPDIGLEEEAAVIEVLRSGWITTGPRTEEFETAFARMIGARHAIGVSSCTAAMHLLMRAAGVGPGDEVVTSAMTFPATANAVLHCGGVPVVADVLPGKMTLDPAAVERAVGPRTKAILPVHFAGWPAEMNALRAIADRAGAALLEDASHALGATYDGRAVGALGDGAAFSFYATKNMTTGEGGMITTDRSEWVERMRVERLHGIDLDASRRDGASYRHWESVACGWKYNLGDMSAALGLVQMQKLPGFVERRRALDRRYRNALASRREIDVVTGPALAQTAAHLFPIVLRSGALRIGRDEMLSALLAENIGVGVHFRALPLHRFFRESLGWRPEDTPVASAASDAILSLPLYPGMTDADQDQVVEALLRIVDYYAA